MRLLLDANLPPRLVELLTKAGLDVVHVAELGLLTADDASILRRAETDRFVLVTADTDFPMLVALRRASSPSVVLLRGVAELPMTIHAELLVANRLIPLQAPPGNRYRTTTLIPPASAERHACVRVGTSRMSLPAAGGRLRP